jgi:UDP-2,3-diacylglucosamine pyrophosphatase LpxH
MSVSHFSRIVVALDRGVSHGFHKYSGADSSLRCGERAFVRDIQSSVGSQRRENLICIDQPLRVRRLHGACQYERDLSGHSHSMTQNPPKRPLNFRSVFLSDVHLGFRGASAMYLLDFLKSTDTEYLYLVGDIVDVWSLRKSFFWPQEHNNIVRLFLSMAKRGTRVIYIPGNHDEIFRDYAGHVFGNLEIQKDAIHVTADGKRLLVIHGDQFDGVIKCARWLELLGDRVYDGILWLNRHFNSIRRKFGKPYWSLATYLKQQAGAALSHIDRFEKALTNEAKRRGFDGVVCGHIHRALIAEAQGVRYMNCGDWVESCTTLVEDHNGRFSLLHWSEQPQVLAPNVDKQLLTRAA